jgi:hypothetical protein
MTDRAHSRFGGSKADKWMSCVGSTALCDTVPSLAAGALAKEGSAAHALAALCLSQDCHPRDYLGLWWQGEDVFLEATAEVQVTEEMCDAVVVYLNAVAHEQARTKDAELYVEQRFVLDVASADPGEVFGSNDAMVYHPSTGRLVVFDYKHGVGVSVSAEDNAQLKFYATGAVWSKPDWRIAELELVIVQPRSRDLQFLPDDADREARLGIKRWPMNPLDLMDFQADVEDAIARAKSVSGPPWTATYKPGEGMSSAVFTTGSHCKWCDAAAVCPQKQRQILDQAKLDFADIGEIKSASDLPDVKAFDVSHLGDMLKSAQLLNDWLNQIQQFVEALVLSGTPVPGWKAVEKIGRAKWVSADEDVAAYVEMLFGIEADAIRPRKLTTITEAEKLLKAAGATKEAIDTFKLQFTIKESSGLTIAPESDKRPAVNAAERAFGDIAV